MIAITARSWAFNHTGIMQRLVDEAEYVLTVLHRTRNEAAANPELYDPDAQERIDEAIARIEEVLRDAQLQVRSAEQNVKAA